MSRNHTSGVTSTKKMLLRMKPRNHSKVGKRCIVEMMFCGSSPKRKHPSSPVTPASEYRQKPLAVDSYYAALPWQQEPTYENLSSLMNNAIFRSPPELPPKRKTTYAQARRAKMVAPATSVDTDTDTDVMSDWPSQVPRPRGQMKLAVYVNHGLLTVHVMQARQLNCALREKADTFVKVSLFPDENPRTRCSTEVIFDTNHPIYDEKFSFELLEEDHKKRMLISVWNRDAQTSCSDILGCMSFGVRHLVSRKKEVNGWYYLLSEDVGRRKHLQASGKRPLVKPRPITNDNGQRNIPEVNKDLIGMDCVTVMMKRGGRTGYGFTVMGSSPVTIGRVEPGSQSDVAGLKKGDAIVRINGMNVSRSTADSVAKLVKNSLRQIVLDVYRPHKDNSLDKENMKPASSTHSHPISNHRQPSSWQQGSEQSCGRETVESRLMDFDDIVTEPEDNFENFGDFDDLSKFEETQNTEDLDNARLGLTDFTMSFNELSEMEQDRQTAIQTLVSAEQRFATLMQAGIQSYSRPLRHGILQSQEHTRLFQNVEKLVAISEFHLRQIDSQGLEYAEPDCSGQFVEDIGSVYESKVQMLSEAYERYCNSLDDALKLLMELQRYREFQHFLQKVRVQHGHLSIEEFLHKPLEHISEMTSQMAVILSHTRSSHQDFPALQKVTQAFNSCCSHIRLLKKRSNSSGSSGSRSSVRSRASTQSMSSVTSTTSVDSEVLEIQSRLLFPKSVQAFHLAMPNRHLIYSGEVMWVSEGTRWVRVLALMFNDVLILATKESSNYWTVIEDPVVLADVVSADFSSAHPSEFSLVLDQASSQSSKYVIFRAFNLEEKCTWKTLLEQRINTSRSQREMMSCRGGDIII